MKKKTKKKRKTRFDTKIEDPKKQTEEDIKEAQFNDPLYCRACRKQFAKDTVFKGHLKGKKHQQADNEAQATVKALLSAEAKIGKMGELLSDQVASTKARIEKKQSLTLPELMRDKEEEQEEPDDWEEEEEEEPVRMTIENYPIGWDGKPIPYWLYKLHGLGIEYKCEICGNQSYWGRKAFEKHFQEWRHAHGMTCLGIPNTLHFQEITKINDAIALWQKIKNDRTKVVWKAEAEEECEDSEGFVLSRKTFEDLKRQGLI